MTLWIIIWTVLLLPLIINNIEQSKPFALSQEEIATAKGFLTNLEWITELTIIVAAVWPIIKIGQVLRERN